jgi:hypothetical protein
VLHGDDVAVQQGRGGCECQGLGFDGTGVERAPDVDDAVAACEQGACFFWGAGVPADALGRGRGGLVDVDALDRLAGGGWVGAADCVCLMGGRGG